MTPRITAIVNPNAAGSRTGSDWPGIQSQLESALGKVDVRFTASQLDATRLTRDALSGGAELIVAVGGDGTINETVNGFFDGGVPVNPNAQLGLLARGTGGDFRRTFALPDALDGQIARLRDGNARPIDLGRLTYTAHTGEAAVRYFNNIASFGVSGAICHTVNKLRTAKRLGGGAAFYYATVKSLLLHRPQRMTLRIDGGKAMPGTFTIVAVCNGQYFGGGMRIAPKADPGDGAFDMVTVGAAGRLGLIRRLGAIYKGAHLDYAEVHAYRGGRLDAAPAADEAAPILLDVDGETPGRLPATFEIAPGALRLRC